MTNLLAINLIRPIFNWKFNNKIPKRYLDLAQHKLKTRPNSWALYLLTPKRPTSYFSIKQEKNGKRHFHSALVGWNRIWKDHFQLLILKRGCRSWKWLFNLYAAPSPSDHGKIMEIMERSWISRKSWKSWKDHGKNLSGVSGSHSSLCQRPHGPRPPLSRDSTPSGMIFSNFYFLIHLFAKYSYSYSSINISSEIVKLVICNNWPSWQWWWWWWWCWQWCWWWWRWCWWWWWWCLCF